MLTMTPTPLCLLRRLSAELGVELHVKRDDLLPLIGGGNKVRKLIPIFSDIASQGYDAVVTNGGVQSNHARVCALMAAERGWRCHLVLHGNTGDLSAPTGNLLLMVLAGASIQVVPPKDISDAIHEAMNDLRTKGCEPYNIPGGAHCLLGAAAYADAVWEVAQQFPDPESGPDVIVLPSGTGTTQAGIQVGCDELGWRQTKVIGISVARRNPRGTVVTQEAYRELCKYRGLAPPTRTVDFRSAWVGEGYGIPDEEVLETIRDTACEDGLVLDPTYTGKAFKALTDLVETREIPRGASVIFWHTGGLLNLCASSHLFK